MELELNHSPSFIWILFITLFLYGIGAIFLLSIFNILLLLHYSYMELERSNIASKSGCSLDYILPIWNWSSCTVFSPSCSFPITLFLYGIGATIFYCFINVYNIELHYSYMELEQINLPCNPSSKSITLFLYGIGAYIFIIDNWHLFTITLFLYGIGAWIEWIKLLEEIIYYIIPIWNWSK